VLDSHVRGDGLSIRQRKLIEDCPITRRSTWRVCDCGKEVSTSGSLAILYSLTPKKQIEHDLKEANNG